MQCVFFIIKTIFFHHIMRLFLIMKKYLSQNNGVFWKNIGHFSKKDGHFSKKDGHFSKNIGHFWKNLPRFSPINSKARCTFVFPPCTTPESSRFAPFSTRK